MSSVVISGDTSGAITLAAPAVAGTNTLSLPAVTDTLVGLAATQTLTNKSIAATQLTGTLPAAQAVSGSIIQVAQYLNYNTVSTTNSSFTATGFALTITPKSASSTMLIRCAISGSQNAPNGAGYFTVYRNGSNLAGDNGYNTLYLNVGYSGIFRVGIPIEITNASGGTSAITYEIYFKTNTVGTVALNNDSSATSITVMEIAP
jgi:hypothetical protein